MADQPTRGGSLLPAAAPAGDGNQVPPELASRIGQPVTVVQRVVTTVRSGAKTAVKAVRVAASGPARAELTAQRLEACQACPNRTGDDCGLCGCPISRITRFARNSCPDQPNRWPS